MAALTAHMPAGVAAPRPLAWVRRAAPVGLALVLHGIALALLIHLVRPPVLEAPNRLIHVELVRPAPEPEPAAVEQPAAPVSEAAVSAPVEPAAPQPADRVPAQSPSQPAARSQEPAPAETAPARPAPQGAVLAAPGGADVETTPPTRSSALRGLACARAFGAQESTVGCEGEAGAGYDFVRFAVGEGAAHVEGLVTARFNALAGLYGADANPALRRLPGQQGMQVMVNRRTGLGGAHEMRDSLPPMVPDPAFGD